MLFNESTVRFYHYLSKKEILGEDATGIAVRKINNFLQKIKKIPVCYYDSASFWESLSSAWYSIVSVTIVSVRYFTALLREKERSLFTEKVNNAWLLQITLESFKPWYFSSTMEKRLINTVIQCTQLFLKNKRQRTLKKRSCYAHSAFTLCKINRMQKRKWTKIPPSLLHFIE